MTRTDELYLHIISILLKSAVNEFSTMVLGDQKKKLGSIQIIIKVKYVFPKRQLLPILAFIILMTVFYLFHEHRRFN